MSRAIDIVRRVAPHALSNYIAAFEQGDALLQAHGITTPRRLAHFLAQVMHESGGLTIEWENLNYTTAERLMEIFGQGRHSAAVAWSEVGGLLRNPPALAERVYGLGNPKKARVLGNTQPGDGYRYRGGGILQTTGRENYRRMGEKCGVDFEGHPELVVSAEHALKSALAEWSEGNLNLQAERDDIETITRKINGGLNGLADRRAWLAKLKPLIASVEFVASPPPPPNPPPQAGEGGERSETGGDGMPPWLARATALLGLYEYSGSADNPLILEMARVCGGAIARDYKHDDIPWCALAVNYILIASGFPGDDSLWALDFQKYGAKLPGPAVGAIATKKRYSGGKLVGGHVFFVVGRTKDGAIVGRGGNQSDMICDAEFDPEVITGYNWPVGYPRPTAFGMPALPIVTPEPKVRRKLAALPPPQSAPSIVPGQVPAGLETPTGAPADAASRPSRGDPDIYHVQELLRSMGERIALDGELGPETEAAVRRFERENWLPQTGGAETWAAFDRIDAELKISPNLRGKPLIYRAQRILRLEGENLDGILGPKTRVAVMKFQAKVGLPVDGRPGPTTQAALDRRDIAASEPVTVAAQATSSPAKAKPPPEPVATSDGGQSAAYRPALERVFSWLIGRLIGRKG